MQLWYDTEDFVNPASWDAAREVARIMTEEGVRGNFNVVGYLAKVLVDNRRFDVIDALKKHVIGTQTLYHSLHPNIVEIADLKDYGEAYRRTLKDEAEGYGMLRAAFNLDRLILSCYPGCSSSHVALDVHSDLGAIFHGGLGAFGGQLPSGDRVWYQNMLQIDYNGTMSLQDVGLSRDLDDAQIAERLDQAARKDAVVFYMHPCMAPCSEFWDGVNFRRGNWCEYGFWQPSERREAKVTAHFYARFRAFLRQLKADSRFEIVDCEKLAAAIRPRQPITKADLPAIRASLAKGLGPVSSPASWCVADVFHAAVAFLNGAERYLPGKVYGFLERPVGVAAPVTVKAADVRAAAKKLAVRRHLPVVYDVGGVKVGRGLTVSADGTLEMTAENLDTVLGFSLAEKLNQLRGVTDMNGKLVYTSDGAAGKSNKTMTVPDEVDYIVVRMAVPLECTTIATTGGVAAAAAADYGCTRIVRGGTAVAIVGGGNTYNLRDGVYCKGEALVKVSFAANGTVNIGVVDVNLASNDNAYPFNVEGYQYV